MAYINLYEVTRAYAGPEEGGQWFNDAVVHYTIRVRGGIYSDRARRAFNAALARFGFTRPGRPLKRWERGSPTMRRTAAKTPIGTAYWMNARTRTIRSKRDVRVIAAMR